MALKLRDYRGVGRPVGAVLTGLGVAIGVCAGIGFFLDTGEPPHPGLLDGAAALAFAAVATVLLGLLVYAYGRTRAGGTLNRREAILSVSLIWVSAGVCGALPFVLGAGLSPVDALFESISGLTTTGATVITDIEQRLSRSLLLWRSLLQWLGGMGIVVLFVAVFPNVGAGGKHLFRGEVPGVTSEGLKPRIAETSFTLWKIYAAFTVVEVAALYLLDMDFFEAVCHALTTMSTGGFSTRDASIGAFQSAAIEYTVAAFMLFAAVNFGLYYAVLRKRRLRVIFRSVELQAFVGIVVLSTTTIALLITRNHDGNLAAAFREAFFMVATFVSSTGYTTGDYTTYPSAGLAIILFLMFVGGCSGSTAGGMKVERLVLMGKQSWREIHEGFRPAVVRAVRMGKSVVQTSALADVTAFFVVFMGTLGVGVLVIAAVEGLPVPAAFGAVLTCVSNMGPAPFHVGGDHFAAYSASSKLCFALFMILGRLEFLTVLALLVPEFWKR